MRLKCGHHTIDRIWGTRTKHTRSHARSNRAPNQATMHPTPHTRRELVEVNPEVNGCNTWKWRWPGASRHAMRGQVLAAMLAARAVFCTEYAVATTKIPAHAARRGGDKKEDMCFLPNPPAPSPSTPPPPSSAARAEPRWSSPRPTPPPPIRNESTTEN